MLRISVQVAVAQLFLLFSIDDTATVVDKQFTRNDIIVLVMGIAGIWTGQMGGSMI